MLIRMRGSKCPSQICLHISVPQNASISATQFKTNRPTPLGSPAIDPLSSQSPPNLAAHGPCRSTKPLRLRQGPLRNFDKPSVEVPAAKKDKYLARLDGWASDKNQDLRAANTLLSSLTDRTLALPHAQSRLLHLRRFIASFKGEKDVFTSISKDLAAELQWWRAELSKSFCGRIVNTPSAAANIPIFVDASTSWGIGIRVHDKTLAFRLQPGWNTDARDINWAEMIAVELAVYALIKLFHPGHHFLIRSDNQGVIGALSAGKSCNKHHNLSLQRISAALLKHDSFLSTQYVPSAQNLADSPSRGILPPAGQFLNSTIPLPHCIRPYLVQITS